MSVHQRHQLWKNALAKQSPEAQQLKQMIETCGLPYSEPAALKQDDPLVQKIIEIVNSPIAIDAALKSTEAGLPALQGVDPILAQTLGVDYGPHNKTTLEAGYWLAQMMHSKGFKNSGKKGTLTSCVAKTAEIFLPNTKY